jgi:hypothetical protein
LFVAVLEKIKQDLNIDSENKAIEYLCMVFNSFSVKAGSSSDLKVLLQGLEKIFGVEIIAKKDKKQIYP